MFEWFRRWRYGGKTGLNQGSNSVRMLIDIALPMCGGYLGIRLFVPYEWTDVSTIVLFCIWIAYVILLISKRKSDATSYIPFPQTHIFYPDGQQQTCDILVPPNGYEQIAPYPDGSVLLRVNLKDAIEYIDPDRPYPDVYTKMLWKCPAEFTTAFERSGLGEFFFGDVFVEHPTCENLALYVVMWKTERTRTPVAVVGSCSYLYRRTLDSMGKVDPQTGLNEADAMYALYMDTLKRADRIEEHNAYLEAAIDETHREKPKDVHDLVEKGVNRAREQVEDIMDTGESLLSKLKNLKSVAIAAIIITLIVIASHVFLGFP